MPSSSAEIIDKQVAVIINPNSSMSDRDARTLGRNSLRTPLVPAVEVGHVLAVPCFPQPGRAQVPIRTDLARHGSQVLMEILDRRPAPKPIAVVEAVNDESRLEHERVRNHRVVLR